MAELPRTPRISGAALRALRLAVKAAPVRKLLHAIASKELGTGELTALEPELRSEMPATARPLVARASHARPTQGLASPTGAPPTCSSLHARYRARETTPTAIFERTVVEARALERRTPSMGPMLAIDEDEARRAAEEATQRFAAGAPRGLLDGVPVTIKEQTDVRGLATRLGMLAAPDAPALADATVVARLRAAGAVVLGHTVMTEYGMNPIGYNPHRTMPRNPHSTGHVAGGSSTGAAVSAAVGLVPVAVGADGGGSIRTPSALCGIFGMKPTFGRVPRTGDQFGGTVNHLGPLGRSTADLAIFLDAVSGADDGDELTSWVPKSDLPARDGLGRGVKGLRIGVDEGEWAEASAAVAQRGKEALAALEKEGAVLVTIRGELLRHAPAIGYQSISLEARAGLLGELRYTPERLGDDLMILVATVGEQAADAYVDAQRLRATLRAEVARHLRDVDVLALPTTGATATAASDAEMRGGFLDPPVLDSLCRFAFLGNLTGLPAATAPVGRDAAGLPIGLQILGDAWDEACVLQVLAHLERMGVARAERPAVWVDIG